MWTNIPPIKQTKYFVTFKRVNGSPITVGPLRGKDEAEGMVSEMLRRAADSEACVEEWEPVRAYTRQVGRA